MIAWDHVQTLRDDIGEDDFHEIVVVFLDEVEEAMARISACSGGEGVAETLHFLKGSALNLGFRTFAKLCETEETALKTNTGPVNLERLTDTYAQSRRVFLHGLQLRLGDVG
ncbi:Hpt domain-containing protein [Oceaniglobus indicus]|uniref:Hpt domain-containing protein n=1 Tax=Oceaniglobus indicus TaxID=2047749 RepID=UPI000C18343D|nr:Hpt domain-containing protein [Oceaniglobus indicus]